MSSPLDVQSARGPGSLITLVRDFDRDAANHRKRISDISQSYPESFYNATIAILKNDLESRAAQYLVTLLLSQNLLFQALCDPALPADNAMALAKMAMRTDPLVDIALARQLADAATPESDTGGLERIMGILDEISDAQRILPSLMRLMRNYNPYLRSKAVLMIGRGGRSLKWIQRRLEESDTRVRANAVEALWGLNGPEAREMLETCTRDSNNRVAGNALLGLYCIGENSALPELVKMAGHSSPAFRRTAAWVMGETGDPRFREILGRMVSDKDADIRKSAFTAVGQIRSAAASRGQSAEWPVSGYASRLDPRTGQRRVPVAVITAEGRESPKILPVQFIVSEKGQTVWTYSVVERPAADAMSVVFLFPRGTGNSPQLWDQGALRCLGWKRPTDLWCTLPYSGTENDASQSEFELPSFIASSAEAATAFKGHEKRTDCTGFWTAVHRAVQTEPGSSRGKRQLIACVTSEVGAIPDDAIIAAVQASRASVQIVSTVASPALKEFCHRTKGHLYIVEESALLEQRISMAYLNLLARYEIRYQPVCPDATELKIAVHTPSGWGCTTIPLPGQA